MKRRDFLGAMSSLPVVPALSNIGKNSESTNVVISMRYQKMMDSGRLRVLKHGDVAKDIKIQNRDIWSTYSEYYAAKFGISIPEIERFDLFKFLMHKDNYWSLGYQKPGFTLNLIDSADGPFKAMIFDIGKKENVAVAESDSFAVVVDEIKSYL